MWLFFLVCFVIGVITECFAQWQQLWVYKKPITRVCNVLFVFTVLFGLISYLFKDNLLLAMALGTVWGVSYEVVNDRWTKAWDFLGNPSWLTGQTAVWGVGIAWGLIPLIAVLTVEDIQRTILYSKLIYAISFG